MKDIVDQVFTKRGEIINKTKQYQIVCTGNRSYNCEKEYKKIHEYFDQNFNQNEIMVIQSIMYFGRECYTGSGIDYKGNMYDVVSYWMKGLHFSIGKKINKEIEIDQMVEKGLKIGIYFESGFQELEKRNKMNDSKTEKNTGKLKEKSICSIDNLIDEIKKLKSTYGKAPIWFRGQEDKEWHLIPSIQRGDLNEREALITNEFYIYVNQIEDNMPNKTNYAAWMSLMQHYGLPTRILDWSSSPLVASYFALEKNRDKDIDACIWTLIPRRVNKQEGFGGFVYPIDAYTVQQMLTPAFKSNYKVQDKFKDKIIACHSVEKNLRMYSQQSAFTVHNSEKRLEDICDSETLFKFVIPRVCKQEFYESIKVLGISTSFIYPDMEHVSKDIIHKYKQEY